MCSRELIIGRKAKQAAHVFYREKKGKEKTKGSVFILKKIRKEKRGNHEKLHDCKPELSLTRNENNLQLNPAS